MIQKSEITNSVWLDVESYVPLDKFYNLINQGLIAHFITIFLFCFTELFGKIHHVGLTVSYAFIIAALYPVFTYLQSRIHHSAQDFSKLKKQNAKAHAVLFCVTYGALLFDNFMYFYDRSVYFSNKELASGKKACEAKMFGLWMLDIICFIILLTWLSCVRALF